MENEEQIPPEVEDETQNDKEENEEEEDLEEEDLEEEEEISQILFGNVNSPIYKKEKDGRRGIKTPQKKIIIKLFSKEINEGTAPRKARVENVQKQIGWPEDISYKVIKSFVSNAGAKNKKRGKKDLESDENE